MYTPLPTTSASKPAGSGRSDALTTTTPAPEDRSVSAIRSAIPAVPPWRLA
jgi:hypothetical protein